METQTNLLKDDWVVDKAGEYICIKKIFENNVKITIESRLRKLKNYKYMLYLIAKAYKNNNIISANVIDKEIIINSFARSKDVKSDEWKVLTEGDNLVASKTNLDEKDRKIIYIIQVSMFKNSNGEGNTLSITTLVTYNFKTKKRTVYYTNNSVWLWKHDEIK